MDGLLGTQPIPLSIIDTPVHIHQRLWIQGFAPIAVEIQIQWRWLSKGHTGCEVKQRISYSLPCARGPSIMAEVIREP